MTGDVCKNPADDKFALNWEGPFRILEALNNEAFQLEHLNEDPIPRTCNVDHL